MVWAFALFCILFLAFANGGNDNFKGVASLYGSGTTTFRRALAWATITTAAGSLTALLLAGGLVAAFSGKGLVPDDLAASKGFALAVALAAAVTVILATRLGFPVSTTHALVGALVGAGLVGSSLSGGSTGVNFGKLQSTFVVPILASPVLAIAGTLLLYPLVRLIERVVQPRPTSFEPVDKSPSRPETSSVTSSVAVLDPPTAVTGRQAGVLDGLHFASAGVVSFARGLNDTPKITALLVVGTALSLRPAILIVAVAIAVGGFLGARRVAETMSQKITVMSPIQGLCANLVTGVLVILASKLSLPVSTTHVSCGALFGIGMVSRTARWKTIASILAAWVTTLPVAAALGALCYLLLYRAVH